MSNHSLHRIVNLEGIFRTAYGILVTSDMIGRNGHMRRPEGRLFVDFFWPFVSQRQRNSILLRSSEPKFVDDGCAGEGFGGIRSQDVLPLILTQGFEAWKFLGFGGMVDVFVDRCFGPNFDVNHADDAFLVRRRPLFAVRLGLPAPLGTSRATRLIRTSYSNYSCPRRSVPNHRLEPTPVPWTRTAQKVQTPTQERGISL